MRVYIKETALREKPGHCADCPICDVDDDCQLLPKWYKTWEEQIKDCPLVEVDRND